MEGFQLFLPPMYDVVWSLMLVVALFTGLGVLVSGVTGALLFATNRARRAVVPVGAGTCATCAETPGAAQHDASR